MPHFMLDTDSVSFALRGQGRVAERILEHAPSELAISSLSLAELRYGAALRRSRRLSTLIDTFVASVPVLPFDEAAADRFGVVASVLRAAGPPIGPFDTLIAAHALARGCVLVSGNARHFSRVKGLRTESWL
jgi:tRNA(fMet)-specific endonuclease VapC